MIRGKNHHFAHAVPHKHTRRYVPVASALLVVAACLAPAVFAKIANNTIDPTATVSQRGTRVRVTGPIQTDAGELVQRVTVTQRSTGAIAQGFIQFRGTGAQQQWEVICETIGDEKFASGPATAVGLARTLHKGDATDAHQWLVNITLQCQ